MSTLIFVDDITHMAIHEFRHSDRLGDCLQITDPDGDVGLMLTESQAATLCEQLNKWLTNRYDQG